MRNAKTWPENVDRFKELILYISQKCANDPKFDTIKLNKLMFFADFVAYGNYGEPITGFQYQKLERGPAPRRMPEIKREMEADKSLGLQKLPLSQWRRPVNLRDPNLTFFSAQQIALVDSLIDALKDKDGDTVSEMSHNMPCWQISSLDEIIPYEMVFLSSREPTNADIERGKAVAAERGLLERVPG